MSLLGKLVASSDATWSETHLRDIEEHYVPNANSPLDQKGSQPSATRIHIVGILSTARLAAP